MSANCNSSRLKRRFQQEAKYWYQVVLPELTGLSKVTIEKRLQQIAWRAAQRPLQPGPLEVIYRDQDLKTRALARIDPKIIVNFDVGPPAPGLPADQFSIMWTGYLQVPESTKYSLFYEHDDGGRIWIDDQPVFDSWGVGVTREQADIQLTAGPHRIRVNYYDGGGTAGTNLLWKRANTEREIIPPSVLFHDPNVARLAGAK